ncbi:MAG: DUF4105 domain-containing protein [Archangium sp.]
MISLAALVLLSAAPDAIDRLQRAGIEVSGPFTDAEVEALARGLDALPEKFRVLPEGKRARVFLDTSIEPTTSGMAEPEWRTPQTFVLTRQLGSASFRDASLTDEKRLLLWRARAIVHLILSRWDDVEQWSLSPRWRRGNGWLLPFERPLTWGDRSLNQAATAFARERGKQSPRLDLLTFAEASLVPVVEELPVDDQLRCQDFTRTRALRTMLGLGEDEAACPAFDAFARADEFDHLEVLLVQSSGRAPESLFGHLLVRPVWKTSLGPSFDTAIQFAAITPPQPDLMHVPRGLFGGYSIGVFTISMTDLEREKLSGEQRSMTRWKLALTKEEALRFLERAWEFERRGRFSYAFFSDNCATLLLWMLESSLVTEDAGLARWPGFITSPGGVLDDLFRARRKNGERLLSALFPPLEATGVVAQRSEAKRRELEKELDGLGADFDGAHSTDVATRAEAYALLAKASENADATKHRALFKWWAHSVRVERPTADEALYEKRKLEDELVEGAPLDLERIWSERLVKLERESVLQKQLMMLDRETFLDDVRRRAKRRPMTPSEAEKAAEYDAQLALFTQVASAHGTLTSEVFEGLDEETAETFLSEQTNSAMATEVVATTRSLPVSGHWRTGVGAGVWSSASGFVPVVRIDEAGLFEALGEQRNRGIGAHTGVRMLEGSLTAAAGGDLRLVQSHFTLIAFDSLAAAIPPANALRNHVGFGFELVQDYRAWRSQKTLYGGQGWAMLHARDAFSRNLIAVGVGPAAWVAEDGHTPMPMAGGSARLIGRLALDSRWPSALRVEAKYQSVFGPGRQLHELRADASLEWVVAWGGRARVLLRPTVSVTAEPLLGKVDALGLLMLEPVESITEMLSRRRD